VPVGSGASILDDAVEQWLEADARRVASSCGARS
jgi:hypothetical protein